MTGGVPSCAALTVPLIPPGRGGRESHRHAGAAQARGRCDLGGGGVEGPGRDGERSGAAVPALPTPEGALRGPRPTRGLHVRTGEPPQSRALEQSRGRRRYDPLDEDPPPQTSARSEPPSQFRSWAPSPGFGQPRPSVVAGGGIESRLGFAQSPPLSQPPIRPWAANPETCNPPAEGKAEWLRKWTPAGLGPAPPAPVAAPTQRSRFRAVTAGGSLRAGGRQRRARVRGRWYRGGGATGPVRGALRQGRV